MNILSNFLIRLYRYYVYIFILVSFFVCYFINKRRKKKKLLEQFYILRSRNDQSHLYPDAKPSHYQYKRRFLFFKKKYKVDLVSPPCRCYAFTDDEGDLK